MLLISSKKTLTLSLLNFCCAINISLLFFMSSSGLPTSISLFSKRFISFPIWDASKKFL